MGTNLNFSSSFTTSEVYCNPGVGVCSVCMHIVEKTKYISCVEVVFEPECSVRMGFHMSFQFMFGAESLEADGAWQLLLLPLAHCLIIDSAIF